MHIRTNLRLAVVAFGLGLCPSVFAVSYTWDFTGSAGSNCTASSTVCRRYRWKHRRFQLQSLGRTSSQGNRLVPQWTSTANGTFQKATLGQYTAGLGVCYPGEDCAQP